MSELAAPPEPLEGAVSWNMTTACNYRCSYCTQRFLDDRGRWARDVPRFLEAFARLPGRWEVKLSGGEPFVHPRFLDVVSGLAALGMRVSVVTNFSAREEMLRAFLDAAGERLGVLSCSLHLEHVDGDDNLGAFLERCLLARRLMPSTASLCVTCVATRASLPRLAALQRRFDDAGVRFKVQPEKQERDVIRYSDEEAAQLLALGGHNLTGNIAPDLFGRPCWAGARYFILDDRGRAFRCYAARRYKLEALGDFLDPGFTLFEGARPCRYHYCNCTVPIERGMMVTKGAPDARAPARLPVVGGEAR